MRQKQRQKKTYQQSDLSSSTSLIADDDITHYGSNDSVRPQEDNESSAEHLNPPPLRDILTQDVLITLINYANLAFYDMCMKVLIPLMWSSSVEHGGLGFSPHTIGLTMGVFGMVNAFIQLNFLGRIIRCFGPRKVYIVGSLGPPISLLCLLGEGYFARRTGGADWRVWAIIVVQLCTETINYFNYGALYSCYFSGTNINASLLFQGSIQIIITGVVPRKSALGTINGMAQAVNCVMGSLAPSFASSLFAISLQRGWAGGNAVYYILLVMTICGIRLTIMLPKTLGALM